MLTDFDETLGNNFFHCILLPKKFPVKLKKISGRRNTLIYIYIYIYILVLLPNTYRDTEIRDGKILEFIRIYPIPEIFHPNLSRSRIFSDIFMDRDVFFPI